MTGFSLSRKNAQPSENIYDLLFAVVESDVANYWCESMQEQMPALPMKSMNWQSSTKSAASSVL
jgi:hypothetical protein